MPFNFWITVFILWGIVPCFFVPASIHKDSGRHIQTQGWKGIFPLELRSSFCVYCRSFLILFFLLTKQNCNLLSPRLKCQKKTPGDLAMLNLPECKQSTEETTPWAQGFPKVTNGTFDNLFLLIPSVPGGTYCRVGSMGDRNACSSMLVVLHFEYYNLLQHWVAWHFFWSEKAAQHICRTFRKGVKHSSSCMWKHSFHELFFVIGASRLQRWCQPWCGDWN